MQSNNHIYEKLATGTKVEELLSSALENAEKKEKKTKDDAIFLKFIVNIGLIFVILVGIGLVFTANLESSTFFYQNPPRQWLFRAILTFVLIILGVYAHKSVKNFLFPSQNQLILKTIYRLAPELARESEPSAAEEASIHRKSVGHWVAITTFFIILALVFVLSPGFLLGTVEVLSEDNMTASVLQAILGVFTIGLYFSVRTLLVVHKEYEILQKIRWQIQKLYPVYAGLPLLKRILPENKKSFVREVIISLTRIASVKNHVSPSDIAAKKFRHERLFSILPFYVTSVMPIMGLIGTILGLIQSIGGLEGVLTVALDNREAFAANISQSLAGVGTAFYTTLAGTCGMLVMKFFTIVVSHAQRNLVVDVRNTMVTELLPRMQGQNSQKKPKNEEKRPKQRTFTAYS